MRCAASPGVCTASGCPRPGWRGRAAGAVVSMREAYPRAPHAGPAEGWPPARPVPEGRLAVAVVLGASGSVITDAFGPYEVFARSPTFSVYTVSGQPPDRDAVGWVGRGAGLLVGRRRRGLGARTRRGRGPGRGCPKRQEGSTAARVDHPPGRPGSTPAGGVQRLRLLAATGLLDGRRATAHWSSIRACAQPPPGGLGPRPALRPGRHPHHHRRGDLGVFGALRLVEQLAGAAEAQRVGQELAYPGWSLHGPTEIRARALGASDLAYLLAVVFPWWRPTVGVGLVEGVGELEVAAPFEVYASSFAARTVPSPPRPPSPPDTGCAWSRHRPTPAPSGSTDWWCLASAPSRRSTAAAGVGRRPWPEGRAPERWAGGGCVQLRRHAG